MSNLAAPAALLALVSVAVVQAADAPAVGDVAPDFKLAASDGKTYQLSDFKGQQAVVVAWFPRAFTGGCTAECKSFRDDGKLLKQFDAAYFTASTDPVEKNTKFAESLELDYPILSDPTGKTATAYGIYNAQRNAAQRVTFIIGADGKILAVVDKVKTKTHGQDIAARLKELGVAKRGE